MRFSIELLLLSIFLFISPIAAIGTSCFKVVSALVGRPTHLFNKFQSEICDAGCQPTVPHWDLWTRNNTFVPAVRSLMHRMNVPHKEEALLQMGDDVALTIKKSCGPMLGGGTHICSDAETLAGFGNCFKRNFLKASIKHLPTLIPMASEDSCKEQLRFLEGDELWEVTIPQNMRDYAKSIISNRTHRLSGIKRRHSYLRERTARPRLGDDEPEPHLSYIPAHHAVISHPSSMAFATHFRPLRPKSRPFQLRHASQFQPLVPPSPSSLGKPTAAKTYTRTRKWLRRFFYASLVTGVAYGIDSQFYASSLTRTARTFSLGLLVAIDYKINFRPNPPLASSIAAVHARNAERLSDLLRHNGGLYLKMGQAIAMQSAILPPEFQHMFSRMFDDAPQNEWKDVEKVIREDFGKSPEEVFGVSFTGESGKGVMERKARASASVAQVHWARLQDGSEVAIKIQKREIVQQLAWDLWAFKVVTFIYSKVFDIPFYSLVPYISERLSLETDFVNEADNSENMAKLVAGEPRLRDRVYIPRVYRELSSSRVMTAEWVEGVRLWDKQAITRPWRGGWRQGSPGCHGTALDQPGSLENHRPRAGKLKPERDYWRGNNNRGGLGLSLKEVMTTMVDLFSAQMFLWGHVHCDPHPGNIFIRRKPNGQPELVLIDHGLYIHMEPGFRHQYARFWKALLTFDNRTLGEIVKGWGVTNPDIFASATLMRPYSGGDMSTQRGIKGLSKSQRAERHYEMQQAARKAIRDILGDETKWPQELIFIGRNLRIVQGNNQFLGSPVNRVKITGIWASRALIESPDLSLVEKMRNLGRHCVFRMVLFTTDIFFYFTKVRQFLRLGGGMEDDLEAQMQVMAKDMGSAAFYGANEVAKEHLVQQIRQACERFGFFQLINHGIPADIQAAVLKHSTDFFSLPTEVKERYDQDIGGYNRGYERLRSQNFEKRTKGDLKEGFYLGKDVPADDDYVLRGRFGQGPNKYPAEVTAPDEFKRVMDQYHDLMVDLGVSILQVLAQTLSLDKSVFGDFYDYPVSILRLLHYPPQEGSTDLERGIGAHTDFGAVTMLLQDETGGLQVWNNVTSDWVDVTPVSGAYVVNLGNMMMQWTNDRYLSNLHRVINKSGKERFSVPFFLSGNPDFTIRCLPNCEDPVLGAKHPPVTVHEWMVGRYADTYGTSEGIGEMRRHSCQVVYGSSDVNLL
ncbi:unnamed protein product [Penicillium olsonii]|uniref:Fe2OG dioxygenase domain-containing protein n=1 Tax=Penicillium olsonii TaxID=99116 RepID=A0A9W4IA74_PENOL|nr:unnamed protein product [Penicillium olsonii]CAG8245674.1 unnamed protein product [Penicillium olsonii]